MADFKEYPKWMTNNNGVRVLVRNKDEEDRENGSEAQTVGEAAPITEEELKERQARDRQAQGYPAAQSQEARDPNVAGNAGLAATQQAIQAKKPLTGQQPDQPLKDGKPETGQPGDAEKANPAPAWPNT